MVNYIPLDIAVFSFLLILTPVALITGPAIPDIILSLIAFYFLIKTFSQKLWKYYKNPVVIGFLIFSFYAIIRSLLSEMPINSLTNEGSAFYFRYIFFLFDFVFFSFFSQQYQNVHFGQSILFVS